MGYDRNNGKHKGVVTPIGAVMVNMPGQNALMPCHHLELDIFPTFLGSFQ